jgi:phosphatidylglycerophosphatase A
MKFLNKYFNFPENLFTLQNRYLLVATVFGLGYAKKAPGTITSAFALVVGLLLGLYSTKLVLFLFVIALIVGFFVAEKSNSLENPDAPHIVIDEFAGQLLAMLLVCDNPLLSVLAFGLFRFFDIKKPWLIGKSEKTFKGGIGIMVDDLLAGFVALFITSLVSVFLK